MTRQKSLEERSTLFIETDRTVREIIEAQGAATRKKTARLKAERLAKEAAGGITELDKKKPPKRK